MIPTFFDLRTGKTARGDDMSVYWWTGGNGACDCNRVVAFGEDAAAQMYHDQHEAKPELLAHQGVCYGWKRFIAIDVTGDLTGYEGETYTKEQILIAMNSEYGT